MVKLLLRLTLAGLLFLVFLCAAAWLSFPRYAQQLIDGALAGKPFRVTVSGIGLPSTSGVGFKSLQAVFSTPPDDCNEEATTYTLSLTNGSISWRFNNQSPDLRPKLLGLAVTLKADALTLVPNPRQFTFGDQNPQITATFAITRSNGVKLALKPLTAVYAVDGAVATREKLQLEGIHYNIRLGAATAWQQPLDTLRIARLSSDGQPAPPGNFRALFGSKRDPLNPCTLTLSGCSVELFQWMASTEQIDYNLKAKRTSFTLNLAKIPLNALPGLSQGKSNIPFATGRVSGSIPIEFQDSTITIRNAMVVAENGTNVTFCDKQKKPLFSIDMAVIKGGNELLKNLNATITFNSKEKKLSALALRDLSATLFGGKITSTPVTFDPETNSAFFTLTLKNIKLLDRLQLLGALKGNLNGGIDGTIPLSIANNNLTIQNGTLQTRGGGSVTITPPAKQQSAGERMFGQQSAEATWSFSEPQVQFSRSSDGKTTLDFKLKHLQQKNSGGELTLTSPKGRLLLWHNRLNPDLLTLSDFTTGFLDGSIALQHIDYDMVKKEGETTIQITHIPLQKILDMQGIKKIYATGHIKGDVPVKIQNESFAILDGNITSEQNGQIIYATSLEERAAANPAMRITYEVLSNLLYAQLISSINMAPDGKSLMTIQLKGANPDFQHGRPVELNLSVQQNLSDLLRSLSISSNVEQIITDKASKKKP
ncbi:MAG: YdbH domain-containing protein [Chlorobium sp.]